MPMPIIKPSAGHGPTEPNSEGLLVYSHGGVKETVTCVEDQGIYYFSRFGGYVYIPKSAVFIGSTNTCVHRGQTKRDCLELKVVSMVTTEDALTNCLFLSPKNFEELGCHSPAAIVSSYDMYYTARPSSQIADGTVATNVVQRAELKVLRDTVIKVQPLPDPKERESKIATSVKFRVEVKQGKVTSIDCMKLAEQVRVKCDHQVVHRGRQLLFNVDSSALICLTVEQITFTAQENPKKGTKQDDDASMLIISDRTIPSLDVILFSTNNDQIVLMNMSDKQKDTQQSNLIQAFQLENLGIGGLKEQFGKVFQRAFASRMLPPSALERLGIKHVKGVLLYGPPGTGKTLIARTIGKILNCKEPKIVNGPEVFNKFVGGTEENVRKLFADAEAEQKSKGDQSGLHLIIFDEFDAICKQRGGSRDSTGVNDNVVNQLLSKIDGVNSLNNVLLIGMTNRKDLIDEAILRPGRFEVHVEIGLPNEEGREEIFRIHTHSMQEKGVLSSNVDLQLLAKRTTNYSGAEIEGVVRAAAASALGRHTNIEEAKIERIDQVEVNADDFENALQEVPPAFGCDDEVMDTLRGGVIDYGQVWQQFWNRLQNYVKILVKPQSNVDTVTLLLHGKPGSGKSAAAAELARSTGFPYIKMMRADDMVGYGELQRVNIIRKAFDDAFKSNLSCIVLDDLERLINFSEYGGRYSNEVLQAIFVLTKRAPPEGKKVLIIGTTSNYKAMQLLELDTVFSLTSVLPLVPADGVKDVAEAMGYTLKDAKDITTVVTQSYPMKQLRLLLEMAKNDEQEITLLALQSAILSAT